MRTLVIGDIHGAKKALIQCLDKCNYDSRKDRLIFLGDYVDGWPESAELVEYLSLHLTNMDHENIFLRGNHDKWCQDWIAEGKRPIIWTQQGGQSTIESYVRNGHITDQSHKDFFNGLHNYYIDDDNRAFVHGGFSSSKGLGHEEYEADYYWNRDLWNIALSGKSTDTPKLLRSHKEIFIGHTTTGCWGTDKPMHACNVWNLDTGAGWEGKLTIMDVDTKEYWQSDLVKELYPGVKGR